MFAMFLSGSVPFMRNPRALPTPQTCVPKAQPAGGTPALQVYLSLLFLSPELQLEYTARLDFLWRVQAKEEINEMKELREHNENMLRNILPSHVARHFLEKDRDNEVSPGLSSQQEAGGV
jgi:hypothetical protein